MVNNLKRGIIIVFEGIDGSGKSTHIERCFNRLKETGLPVYILREPTKGKYGQQIKKILLGKIPRGLPEEELNLFIMDRKEDVNKNILPILEKKGILLMDRYYHSTIAYQGAMGFDINEIRKINEDFAPIPDLVFIFLVSVEKGLERIKSKRLGGGDNYEKKAFLKKVDSIYRSLKDKQIRYIDTEKSIEEVNSEVDRILDLFLKERGFRS